MIGISKINILKAGVFHTPAFFYVILRCIRWEEKTRLIINDTEFKNALKQVKEPLSLTIADISPIMSSEEINYNNAMIRDALNKLYERVRILEDIHMYSDTYIKQKIQEKKTTFKQTIKKIEDNADQYTDGYRGIPVSFQWSSATVQGRDGTILQPMTSVNDQIRSDGVLVSTAQNATMSHECQYTPQYMYMKDGKIIASYLLDTSNHLYDSIQILFSGPKQINLILLNTTLSVAAACICEDNTEISVPLNTYFSPVIAKGIILDVILTEGKTVEINLSSVSQDAFEQYDTVTQSTSWKTAEEASSLLTNKTKELNQKLYNRNIISYTKAWEQRNG